MPDTGNGKGKGQDKESQMDGLDSDNPCHPRACALQSCMQRTWDQEKCTKELRALYVCCSRLYQTKGTKVEVDACPLPEVLRGKLSGLGEEANF